MCSASDVQIGVCGGRLSFNWLILSENPGVIGALLDTPSGNGNQHLQLGMYYRREREKTLKDITLALLSRRWSANSHSFSVIHNNFKE